MADVFKIVGDLFGISSEETTSQAASQPIINPVDERKALAELDGTVTSQPDELRFNVPLPRSVNTAIRRDGTVDFAQLFSQAGLANTGSSAEQAVKILGNIEKALPASITDPEERNRLLRSLVVATVTEPAELDALTEDAKQKSNFLRTLVRARLDSTADFKQKSQDRIRQLKQQIADTEAGIAKSESQFLSFSAVCKERETLYDEVVNLLIDCDGQIEGNESKKPKP